MTGPRLRFPVGQDLNSNLRNASGERSTDAPLLKELSGRVIAAYLAGTFAGAVPAPALAEGQRNDLNSADNNNVAGVSMVYGSVLVKEKERGGKEAAPAVAAPDLAQLETARSHVQTQLRAIHDEFEEMGSAMPHRVADSHETMRRPRGGTEAPGLLFGLSDLNRALRPYNNGRDVIPISGTTPEQLFQSLNNWLNAECTVGSVTRSGLSGRRSDSPIDDAALQEIALRVALANASAIAAIAGQEYASATPAPAPPVVAPTPPVIPAPVVTPAPVTPTPVVTPAPTPPTVAVPTHAPPAVRAGRTPIEQIMISDLEYIIESSAPVDRAVIENRGERTRVNRMRQRRRRSAESHLGHLRPRRGEPQERRVTAARGFLYEGRGDQPSLVIQVEQEDLQQRIQQLTREATAEGRRVTLPPTVQFVLGTLDTSGTRQGGLLDAVQALDQANPIVRQISQHLSHNIFLLRRSALREMVQHLTVAAIAMGAGTADQQTEWLDRVGRAGSTVTSDEATAQASLDEAIDVFRDEQRYYATLARENIIPTVQATFNAYDQAVSNSQLPSWSDLRGAERGRSGAEYARRSGGRRNGVETLRDIAQEHRDYVNSLFAGIDAPNLDPADLRLSYDLVLDLQQTETVRARAARQLIYLWRYVQTTGVQSRLNAPENRELAHQLWTNYSQAATTLVDPDFSPFEDYDPRMQGEILAAARRAHHRDPEEDLTPEGLTNMLRRNRQFRIETVVQMLHVPITELAPEVSSDLSDPVEHISSIRSLTANFQTDYDMYLSGVLNVPRTDVDETGQPIEIFDTLNVGDDPARVNQAELTLRHAIDLVTAAGYGRETSSGGLGGNSSFLQIANAWLGQADQLRADLTAVRERRETEHFGSSAIYYQFLSDEYIPLSRRCNAMYDMAMDLFAIAQARLWLNNVDRIGNTEHRTVAEQLILNAERSFGWVFPQNPALDPGYHTAIPRSLADIAINLLAPPAFQITDRSSGVAAVGAYAEPSVSLPQARLQELNRIQAGRIRELETQISELGARIPTLAGDERSDAEGRLTSLTEQLDSLEEIQYSETDRMLAARLREEGHIRLLVDLRNNPAFADLGSPDIDQLPLAANIRLLNPELDRLISRSPDPITRRTTLDNTDQHVTVDPTRTYDSQMHGSVEEGYLGGQLNAEIRRLQRLALDISADPRIRQFNIEQFEGLEAQALDAYAPEEQEEVVQLAATQVEGSNQGLFAVFTHRLNQLKERLREARADDVVVETLGDDNVTDERAHYIRAAIQIRDFCDEQLRPQYQARMREDGFANRSGRGVDMRQAVILLETAVEYLSDDHVNAIPAPPTLRPPTVTGVSFALASDMGVSVSYFRRSGRDYAMARANVRVQRPNQPEMDLDDYQEQHGRQDLRYYWMFYHDLGRGDLHLLNPRWNLRTPEGRAQPMYLGRVMRLPDGSEAVVRVQRPGEREGLSRTIVWPPRTDDQGNYRVLFRVTRDSFEATPQPIDPDEVLANSDEVCGDPTNIPANSRPAVPARASVVLDYPR